jgi:hypothetical protein
LTKGPANQKLPTASEMEVFGDRIVEQVSFQQALAGTGGMAATSSWVNDTFYGGRPINKTPRSPQEMRQFNQNVDNMTLGMIAVAGSIAAAGVGTSLMVAGSTGGSGITIGLGLSKDLGYFSGTATAVWHTGSWQRLGLTNVDFGRVLGGDSFAIKRSFEQAASKASQIKFNVTNFNPFYSEPGFTSYEFNYIINNPDLLQKTKFIKNYVDEVIWNGIQFLPK